MISHLKRHVNKGETEASYSGTSDVSFEEPGEKILSVSPFFWFENFYKSSI